VANQVRWVHTDRGHRPEPQQFPQWQGESVGFWDGPALVVHTNQIRQWNTTHSMFEWSDQMTTVERYERSGDAIVAEVTLYDPVAFLQPLQARIRYTLHPRRGASGLQYVHGYQRALEQHLRQARRCARRARPGRPGLLGSH